MEHWDDIRFFLAVARHGSVRAASIALNVNHSTVLRRMAQLEGHLGVSLFNKLPSGYELTEAGDEILELSERMEATTSELQTRVFARDQRLVGKLRIAVPPTFATDLLMSDFADFSKLHPEIELQIVSSYDLVNLTMRQADLAIRLVYDQQTLPQHLFATKLHPVYRGVYIHHQLGKDYRPDNVASYKWILKEEDGVAPEWAAVQNMKTDEAICWVSDLATQLAAVRAQMGLTILPCFIGDKDPNLMRAPNSSIEYYGGIWLLAHGETRKTKRVRLFRDFIKTRMKRYSKLLDGSSYGEAASGSAIL